MKPPLSIAIIWFDLLCILFVFTAPQLLLVTNELTDQPDNQTGAANVYDLNGDDSHTIDG